MYLRRPASTLAVALAGLSLVLAGCRGGGGQPSPTPSSGELAGPQALRSYRWTTELRADSSLFDQSKAPDALRSSSFVLKAHVDGERVLPDRERLRTVVEPAAIGTRESVTVGGKRWNRIGNGPWRVGEEAFPAARAYFGGTATLSARTILEAEETPSSAQLRTEIASMPYQQETVATGPARRYSMRPEQVASILGDAALNPFAVLATLPAVRIDFWIDERRNVLVGVRVAGDTAMQAEAFLLDIHVTEMEPPGLRIDPPR
ncbi:MAG: hypothetical protein EPO16_12350 [Dehalococcoidia bacterium]|nr:MAG: hypothetical protein EPO16_12350 [Dehalococcoidia bacterium]